MDAESMNSMNVDSLIANLGGCGQFQVLMTFFASFLKAVAAMSMMLMAFGNYNPGWQCLDDSSTGSNGTVVQWKGDNVTQDCTLFRDCTNVQFAPKISTVVSEWHLVCEKEWVSSFIISMQMLGVLIGSILLGYLGDKFGRKKSLCGFIFFHMVTNVITIFSNSWYMFTVMRFTIGLTLPTIIYSSVVLVLEYVSPRWRNTVICLPIWSIGGALVALMAMATEDWKWLHGIIAVASFIILVPFYWIPDSLRWLVVKDKLEDARTVVNTIAKINRVDHDVNTDLEQVAHFYERQNQGKGYSCFYLLRPGLRYATFVIGFLIISLSLIYYALSFGVKAMPGNFYTNLILMSSCDIPIATVSCVLPNYIGRKKFIIVLLVTSAVSLFVIVGLDLRTEGNLKTIGILGSAMVTRMCVEAAWDVSLTFTAEYFPTVIRSTSMAFTSWIARIGGITAPYLIPSNRDLFYINYLVMAVLAFICCVLVVFLTETKGKALKDIMQVNGKNADTYKSDVNLSL